MIEMSLENYMAYRAPKIKQDRLIREIEQFREAFPEYEIYVNEEMTDIVIKHPTISCIIKLSPNWPLETPHITVFKEHVKKDISYHDTWIPIMDIRTIMYDLIYN
jgi:hypothetical protein